ncbi:hypothetical protein JMJ35_003605 [Cladonia borealis]|uniref:Uncharacterized protein n=1 Tax=Cladonia borealis TaxID=184061 RepID=A0AA39V2V1_9LECA|nr:hypothetical protein JMJ35_003605 [Cladonia borealis]
MHTKFSGSNGQNAHRWLRTLRFENPHFATVSPSDWLGIIDGLLEGDAATWADHHPRVKYILRTGSLKQATRADVETFKKALIARFPPVEVRIDHSRPALNISSPILFQEPNEDLDSYYQRTLALLYQRNGVDLAEAPLTEQEQNALKRTVMSYIAGLNDREIRREADKVWTESNASLSLHQMHKLSKDQMLLRWFGGKENLPETRLPGHAARDQTPDRANVPGSSFDNVPRSSIDNPAFRDYMENVANPDNLPKPNNPSFATGASDRRNMFDDLFGTPTAERFYRKPTSATASPWSEPQNPSPERGFTSRMGNSHHTPKTSYGSNSSTTLPNASTFGGASGSPFRPQSSIIEDLPPYSIFDARHSANPSAARFFANGAATGANNANPPHHYPGMPPPGLSPLQPLRRNPTSGLFGDGPAPGRASKRTSPNRHSRRPSNLDVEIDHLPPSRLSEDTVRQFYSPNRNIFGTFGGILQSPRDGPNAGNPSNNDTAANNASSTNSHHQAPSIEIQTPSIFDTRDISFPSFEDRPTRDDSKVVDDFFTRHFPEPDAHPSSQATDPHRNNRGPNPSFKSAEEEFKYYFSRPNTHPSSQATEPAHERQGPHPPFQSAVEEFNNYFHRPNTHSSPQTTNPTHERHARNLAFENAREEFERKFYQRDTHPSSQSTSPIPNYRGPNDNPPFRTPMDAYNHALHRTNTHPHPPSSSQAPSLPPNNNDRFQPSMDDFTRDFTRLDTHPSDQSTSPPLTNPTLSSPHNANPPFSPSTNPKTKNANVPHSPSPLSYSQTLATSSPHQATATAKPSRQPTAESDPDSELDREVEIPITIKQSQGKKKRRRRQRGRGGVEKGVVSGSDAESGV